MKAEEIDLLLSTGADGTRKAAFYLASGHLMEAAFFRIDGRERPYVACVSTQVGCAVGCRFCATACDGFIRNLSAEEIFEQARFLIEDAGLEGKSMDHVEVSFMGMGEPLANRENLLAALEAIHGRYPEISRVSISTAGPSHRIEALTSLMPAAIPVHLQISLHATEDATRRQLIPNAPDTISNILEAGKRFHQATGDRVCLNYILLRGLNDRPQDAQWLADLDPRAFYLKLAALNSVDGMPADLTGLTEGELVRFGEPVRSKGLQVKVFVGDGLDIHASCGQMAATPVEIAIPSLEGLTSHGG